MRNTIKKHKDFATDDSAPIVIGRYFIAKARPTIFPNDARYGLIATKRTFKLAVDRNRAKRLLRVWIHKNEPMMRPDTDYIFIARRLILDATKPAGVKKMAKALKELANSH
ncbi:MAG: ribonuclease P protein component [Rickettsiales bacterium]|jgi:ribonuclease P protein component|nr:ribonuclease P protein component [Rickettsiales bacterium]